MKSKIRYSVVRNIYGQGDIVLAKNLTEKQAKKYHDQLRNAGAQRIRVIPEAKN